MSNCYSYLTLLYYFFYHFATIQHKESCSIKVCLVGKPTPTLRELSISSLNTHIYLFFKFIFNSDISSWIKYSSLFDSISRSPVCLFWQFKGFFFTLEKYFTTYKLVNCNVYIRIFPSLELAEAGMPSKTGFSNFTVLFIL